MNEADQRFTAALHQAVEQMGADHVADPRYSDPGPNGTIVGVCIIGKVMELLGETIPTTNAKLAYTLAHDLGCSPKIAAAAYIAQCANDQRVAWKYVEELFEKAILRYEAIWAGGGFANPGSLAVIMAHAINEAMLRTKQDAATRARERLTEAAAETSKAMDDVATAAEAATTAFAKGGIVSPEAGLVCADPSCYCNGSTTVFSWNSAAYVAMNAPKTLVTIS